MSCAFTHPTTPTTSGEQSSSISADQDHLSGRLVRGLLLAAFDEFAVFELRAGSDERDQVRCIHRAPAGLCGLDSLKAIATPAAREPGPLVTR